MARPNYRDWVWVGGGRWVEAVGGTGGAAVRRRGTAVPWEVVDAGGSGVVGIRVIMDLSSGVWGAISGGIRGMAGDNSDPTVVAGGEVY